MALDTYLNWNKTEFPWDKKSCVWSSEENNENQALVCCMCRRSLVLFPLIWNTQLPVQFPPKSQCFHFKPISLNAKETEYKKNLAKKGILTWCSRCYLMKLHLSPDVFTLKSSDRNMISGYCGMYVFIQGAQLPGTVIVMDVFTSTLQISPI